MQAYEQAQSQRQVLLAAIDASLGGVDLLAGPTVGYCAPQQDPPFGVGDDSGEGRFTGPYNLTGHPAVSLSVPTPGLPVGLQLAGRRGGDTSLLQLAAEAERVLAAEAARLLAAQAEGALAAPASGRAIGTPIRPGRLPN